MPHLLHLHEVYRALLKQRAKRGAVDFETTETQIVCDDNGRIEKIVPRTRTEAHRLIEESMLAANVCAAEFISGAEHPCLFRVHEGPTPEKRVALQAMLRALGVACTSATSRRRASSRPSRRPPQDRPDATQIHTLLLRSMQQAIYTVHNAGHFGLAYDAYTHFTSPIRRYPDLLVHRVIKAMLAGRRYHLAASDKTRKPELRKGGKSPRSRPSRCRRRWRCGTPPAAIAAPTNAAPTRPVRDVEAWLKCRYMREHLGEEFSGTVSAVAGFGLFVTLDALYVDGLVHITELGGEYYRFDEARGELRGERTGIRYAVGTRVRVQVSRVDLDGRKIDFRMVRDGDAERLLARGDKARPAIAGSGSAAEELAARARCRPRSEGGHPCGQRQGRCGGHQARRQAGAARARRPSRVRGADKSPRTRR